jgi:glycosyltransferase involved in cell wall biosynthesis
VSDLPGMTEIIKDGENGFVFRTGDVSELSRKIISIFADNERNQKVARKGFEHVRDRYDWRQVSIATNELYKKVYFH